MMWLIVVLLMLILMAILYLTFVIVVKTDALMQIINLVAQGHQQPLEEIQDNVAEIASDVGRAVQGLRAADRQRIERL